MTHPGPFENDDDPLAGMAAALNEMMQSMSGSPLPSWEQARQMAAAVANDGVSEANVAPLGRMKLEQFSRVAELQIAEATGLRVARGGGVSVEAVNRTEWTSATLDSYRPLFERLSDSLGQVMRSQLDELGPDLMDPDVEFPAELGMDPRELLSGLSQLLGPMMLSMMAGSVVGQLGRRAFGSYDLPIPREDDRMLVVLDSVDAFGRDWSLPEDDLRLWICLDEMCHAAVLGVPHVRAHLRDLLCTHAAGFGADSSVIESRLSELRLDEIDPTDPTAMADLQRLLGDPELVLSAIRSEEQERILPRLEAVVTAVEGYVEWVLDDIGGRLLPSHDRMAEALRRRRVEADQASRFVERLFGLELSQDLYDAGRAFTRGVVERRGPSALRLLWTDPQNLPTPAEIAAPGLWLARIAGDQGDTELPELDEPPDIPDFPDLAN